jgi:hypothetical protein
LGSGFQFRNKHILVHNTPNHVMGLRVDVSLDYEYCYDWYSYKTLIYHERYA